MPLKYFEPAGRRSHPQTGRLGRVGAGARCAIATWLRAGVLACLLAILALGPGHAHDPTMPGMPAAAQRRPLQDVIASVLPAVVNIIAWRSDLRPLSQQAAAGTPRQRSRLFGSGFIIDPSGVIVTNNHVIAGADEITVGFMDGSRRTAHLFAAAPAIDLALLRLEPAPASPTPHYPVLEFGDSDDLRVGDAVIAVGNPLAIGISVSAGIISALNRTVQVSPYDNLIQTDAAINHGNSGGPLVDLQGRVIGVNTAIVSNVENGGSIGLGFAIPADDARFVVSRLLKYGRVRPGWLGLQVQDVTADIAVAAGLDKVQGAIVTGTEKNSPAERMDVHPGDIVQTLDDTEITDARALMRAVARVDLGKDVTLGIWRSGQALTVRGTVAEWPGELEMERVVRDAQAKPQPRDFGLHLAPLDDALRQKYALMAEDSGVVVTAVDDGSPAGDRGVVAGDLILQVGTTSVDAVPQVMDLLHAREDAHREFALVLVRQKEGRRWITLRLRRPD